MMKEKTEREREEVITEERIKEKNFRVIN